MQRLAFLARLPCTAIMADTLVTGQTKAGNVRSSQMDLAVRLNSLTAKHAEIERNLDAEHAKPAPDEIRLTALQKQKLKLKDEIGEWQRQMQPTAAPADTPHPPR